MSSAGSGSSPSRRWQQLLEDECKRRGLAQPQYSTSSDRRGGRTAWSCSVIVAGRTVAARNWYDGNYLNNAREDAAQLMLQQMQSSTRRSGS